MLCKVYVGKASLSSINIISSTINMGNNLIFLLIIVIRRTCALDLLGKQIMLDFEPLKAAIPEGKYVIVHINSR